MITRVIFVSLIASIGCFSAGTQGRFECTPSLAAACWSQKELRLAEVFLGRLHYAVAHANKLVGLPENEEKPARNRYLRVA